MSAKREHAYQRAIRLLKLYLQKVNEKTDRQLNRMQRTLETITKQQRKIMGSQAELAEEVRGMKAQVTKIGSETRSLITKVGELIALLEAGGNVTPELRTAVNETKEQLQIVDDLVPDAPPTTP